MCFSSAAACGRSIMWRWWLSWMRRSNARILHPTKRRRKRPGGKGQDIEPDPPPGGSSPIYTLIDEVFSRIRALSANLERNVHQAGERQDVLEGVYASMFGDRHRFARYRRYHLDLYGCGIDPADGLSAGEPVDPAVHHRADRPGHGDPRVLPYPGVYRAGGCRRQ